MKKLFICLTTVLAISCVKHADTIDTEALTNEVSKAEDDFKNLSQSKGIAEAFYAFADENAVIKRENDTLIKGRENIKKYYSSPKFKNASVTWKPDFADVSADGTLAYTYGKYD
jgi:hypothetical protein